MLKQTTTFSNTQNILAKITNQPLVRLGLLTAVFSLLTTGCAMVQGKSSPNQYANDASITAQIKAKMVQSDSLSAANIHVETQNQVIQMSGFASNHHQIAEASRIARMVCPSCQVINDIAYSPKSLKRVK